MSDNLKKKILLVGAGQMAVDYYKVLQALHCGITTIGRSESSASQFAEKTGSKIITGGIESFLQQNNKTFDAVIVAVGMEQLAPTAFQLINKGFKNILLEKPAGLNETEIKELAQTATHYHATVLVAYNRRFYSSVLKAKEIIEQDGGVTSFNFEFTEWAHTIEPLVKAKGIKENWLLANSSHVIDLAFYLGGKPSKINCYADGKLSWHDKAVFSGAGKTKDDVLFSYQANWDAPGRWGVEILTSKSRLILRPLEELQIQLKNSVAINKVEIDTTIDKQYKPGLFLQTKQFLTGKLSEFKNIQEQAEMCEIYSQIAKGN
ncbi:MAG: myo-inositol 2-dehydrogenase [Bacteroidetes bacterium RIFCSPLOWO2_12_FULL_35_15]|nr:MAG: myo-inositol 2-dehydrogenase [Bacteroidetes bacterium RIFCSPLOWO2_12_FULL_35_15]